MDDVTLHDQYRRTALALDATCRREEIERAMLQDLYHDIELVRCGQEDTEHNVISDETVARLRRVLSMWPDTLAELPIVDEVLTCRSMEQGTPLSCDFLLGHEGPHSFDYKPGGGDEIV